MIQVSFDIDNEITSFRDTVRAKDIVRASSVAAMRYPEHDIRLAPPIAPETFLAAESGQRPGTLDLTGGRQA